MYSGPFCYIYPLCFYTNKAKFMKILMFLTILTTLKAFCFGQTKYDAKIIIITSDSVGLYEKTKIALVNTDFIVKDNYNRDTLTTYVRELNSIPGYMLVKAIIVKDTITLTGIYGLKRINDWGYTTIPKNYNEVIFYRGSKTWRILLEIANKIPGKITFGK